MKFHLLAAIRPPSTARENGQRAAAQFFRAKPRRLSGAVPRKEAPHKISGQSHTQIQNNVG